MTDERRAALNQRIGLLLIAVAVAVSLVRPLAGAIIAGVGVWLALGAGLQRRRMRAAARAADPIVLPRWGRLARAVCGLTGPVVVGALLLLAGLALIDEVVGTAVARTLTEQGAVVVLAVGGLAVAGVALAVWLLAAFWSGYRENPRGSA